MVRNSGKSGITRLCVARGFTTRLQEYIHGHVEVLMNPEFKCCAHLDNRRDQLSKTTLEKEHLLNILRIQPLGELSMRSE